MLPVSLVSLIWVCLSLVGVLALRRFPVRVCAAISVAAGGVVWFFPTYAPVVAVGCALLCIGLTLWEQRGFVPLGDVAAPAYGHVYRPDIDGLRAVAIIPVVVFHAFPTVLASGFIGVDIFFVISGFLISQIMLEQYQNGTFRYRDFYARRVRRIFPALSIVLLAVMVAGWFLLFRNEFRLLNKHVIAGVLFVSNLFSYTSVDYFAPAVYSVPLIHLWSLGVEEQFYIVWPLVIGLAVRQPRRLLTAFIAIGVLSFVCTQYLQATDPDAAFYWPISRFWELTIGGVAAWFVRHRSVGSNHPRTHTLRQILSVCGMALICTGFATINEQTTFPGSAALLPTVGAFLLIISGPHTWIARHILSNRLLVFVGLVSYPLYLWHWPVLSFAQIYYEWQFTALWRILAIIGSFGAAVATYWFLERPVRNRTQHSPVIPTRVILSAMLTVAICSFASWYLHPVTLVSSDGAHATAATTPDPIDARSTVKGCDVLPGAETFRGICKRKESAVPQGKEYIIIGDSLAVAFSRALFDASDAHSTTLLAWHGCLPLPGMDSTDGQTQRGCTKSKAIPGIFRSLADMPVGRDRVLFVVGAFSKIQLHKLNPYDPKQMQLSYRNHPQTQTEEERDNDYAASATELFRIVTALPHTTVVFVDQFPVFPFAPDNCLRRKTITLSGRSCTVPRAVVDQYFSRYRSIIDRVLVQFPQVQRLDPLQTFCDASYCYAARDGVLLYQDDVHPNLRGSREMLPDILARFP